MVDPTPGTETTKVLHSTGTAPPTAAPYPNAASRCNLTVGERWRGYQVDAPAANGRLNTFEATNIGRMENVLITARLVTKGTSQRRAIWNQLHSQLPQGTRILTCLEAHEEEGWRYEVTSQPSATTLREWIACHQAEGWAQRLVLEQLTATVSALHSLGIVLLNIQPETIYLNGEGSQMEVILGGLETSALYKQSGTVVAETNLFYAPPEAVDSDGLKPGIGLCAWDWWSVGRVIQEMILGRHVMSMLFGSDVIRDPSPEVRERAKSLLLELEPPSMRAGAVEAMPRLDPAMKIMLRGLLTSARDARWDGEAVRLWLTKENVSNHYELPRDARFFIWKGRGRPLAEAAQYFRTEENWADGEQNIFEPNNEATLAHFLSTEPRHVADWKKWQDVCANLESPEWAGLPEAARRSVISAFVWLAMGPQPGAFVVIGKRIDVAGLTELLNSGQDSLNCDIVKVLMSAPCLALMTTVDASAAQFLKQLSALGGEAVKRAEENRWFDPNDAGNLAYLLKLSLEAEQVIRKKADRVRNSYAACRDSALDAMLGDKHPAPWVNILLVATAENPRRFGYVTKAEHTLQHRDRLKARKEQLQVALFWLRLKEMLQAGRPWSGSWRLFSLFWLGLVVFGVAIARDVPTTGCMALGLIGLRFLLGWRVQALVGRFDPGALPWTFRDGPDRSLLEIRRGLAETTPVSRSRLNVELDETEKAIAALPAEKLTDPAKPAPHLSGLLPLFTAAVVLCVVGSIQLLKNFGGKIGSEIFSVAWSKPESGVSPGTNQFKPDSPEGIAMTLKEMPGLSPEMVEKVKQGEYEIVKGAFGYALQGPIQKWNFQAPAVVPPLPVESRSIATAEQRAFALVSGELLLRPYGRKGVTALFVVRVPTPNGFGLMLYNARSRQLVDNDALHLRQGLPDNTWYRLDRYNVIYLGAPSQISVNKQSFISKN